MKITGTDIQSTILRYILSGLIASGVMFLSLVFLREILHIWYLYSSSLAFVMAFVTSFLLQKFWTFKNNTTVQVPRQLTLFLVVSLIGLGVNGLGMFILVDKIGIWYLVSQIIMTTLIAASSFFSYRMIFLTKTSI